MCGRFTLRTPAQLLVKQFRLDAALPLRPRYNIAPTQGIAVVRAAVDETGKPVREMATMRWGLVPSWADDPTIGNRMINARAETVAEKPAFRAALKKRRCLVLSDGYYEWTKSGKAKQPYLFHMEDDRAFALAGLWESWNKGPQPLESCTIITTDANAFAADFHDRMPAILDGDAIDAWLDPAQHDSAALAALLRPYAYHDLTVHAVSTLVNSPAHEDARCIEPLAVD